MDIKVWEAQHYLNVTYSGNPKYGALLDEDGRPGTAVCEALVIALQIELGIASPTGYFGDATATAFTSQIGQLTLGDGHNDGNSSSDGDGWVHDGDDDGWIVDDYKMRIVKLVQHAMYCKGYECGGVTGEYNAQTKSGIASMQSDAGVPATGNADHYVMKAVMNTDPYNGVSTTAQIQRALNGKYYRYTGIQACDGVYGRGTNEALIYGIQAEEGLSVSTANGYWGPTTRGECPSLPYSGGEYSGNIGNFVKLLQYALYFNGFYPSANFDGQYGTATKNAVSKAREFFVLSSGTNTDLFVWMALTISHGYQNRLSTGMDCATQLKPSQIDKLMSSAVGKKIVGRYLTGTYGANEPYNNKYLTVGEERLILSKGMKFFPIFQTGSVKPSSFTYARGQSDAAKAYQAAKDLLIPLTTIIYFAVDYDMMDVDITNNVIPYFRGLNDTANLKNNYKIGIYGARNTCTRVKNAGLSVSSFVSNMSYGYSGNIGYTMPTDWAYDQYDEYDVLDNMSGGTGASFAIDDDMVSSRAQPVTFLDNYTPNFTHTPTGFEGIYRYNVNTSNESIPVYKEMSTTSTLIGQISPNQSYSLCDNENQVSTKWYKKVLIKSGTSLVFGYMAFATDGGAGKNELSFYSKQKKFGNYGTNGSQLTTPEKSGDFNLFTVKKPTVFYDGDGKYAGILRVGDQIALYQYEDYCLAGTSFKQLMLIHRIKKDNTDKFIYANGIDDYAFIDMKENLGNLNSRSLW